MGHIENDNVLVIFKSEAICSDCDSKGMCIVSGMTEKLIEIRYNKS